MFVEKREMDVLTVPDCARFLQGHPIYAEDTHAEFSKSPMVVFLMPPNLYRDCACNCARIIPLFCLPPTVLVKYTRITSKSPMEWFFLPQKHPGNCA
jgi:hypothetical protein